MRAKGKTQGKKATSPTSKSTGKNEDVTPLMATAANLSTQRTSSRRNRAADISRTDKYKNIDDGLIPWRYSAIYGEKKISPFETRLSYAKKPTIILLNLETLSI